jgi:DNA-binding CsgD family transcriptional regulator
VAINRTEGHDFTERDRELASDIQELVRRAYGCLRRIQEQQSCLTGRELETLRILETGATQVKAARMMGIKPTTVAQYMSSAYRKLEVTGLAAAVKKAREFGLL